MGAAYHNRASSKKAVDDHVCPPVNADGLLWQNEAGKKGEILTLVICVEEIFLPFFLVSKFYVMGCYDFYHRK